MNRKVFVERVLLYAAVLFLFAWLTGFWGAWTLDDHLTQGYYVVAERERLPQSGPDELSGGVKMYERLDPEPRTIAEFFTTQRPQRFVDRITVERPYEAHGIMDSVFWGLRPWISVDLEQSLGRKVGIELGPPYSPNSNERSFDTSYSGPPSRVTVYRVLVRTHSHSSEYHYSLGDVVAVWEWPLNDADSAQEQ